MAISSQDWGEIPNKVQRPSKAFKIKMGTYHLKQVEYTVVLIVEAPCSIMEKIWSGLVRNRKDVC